MMYLKRLFQRRGEIKPMPNSHPASISIDYTYAESESKSERVQKVLRGEVALWAQNIKTILQMGIGVGLAIIIFLKLLHDLNIWPISISWLDAIFGKRVLEIVGDALLYSSAIELAYTLFTPGPDEAVEPLITGLAAVILIGISSIKYTDPVQTDDITRNLVVYIIVLAILFTIRQLFILKAKK